MRCKPGDLAWIVQSPGAPENLWRLVRVIRPYRDYVGAWECEALQRLTGFDFFGPALVRVTILPGGFVACKDAWLKPFPPDEHTEETIKEVETT